MSGGKLFTAAAVAALLAGAGGAQAQTGVQAGAAAETVAIVGARIETAAGPAIPSGTVVLSGGRIAAVGAGVTPPAGARIIDGAGKVVTPGLIAPSTNLTVSEVDLLAETRDDRPGQELSAGFDVQYGVNLISPVVGLARAGGITRAAVTPAAGVGGGGHAHDDAVSADMAGGDPERGDPGLFTGQAAVVALDSGAADPVVRPRAAVAVNLGQMGGSPIGSRGSALVLVRSALADARLVAANPRAMDGRDSRYAREDLAALVPVVQGRTPLLVRVERAADIRQVLRLAREERIKVILEGASEGWVVAGEIAAAGVPVIVDAQADLPQGFDALGSRLDNPARLAAAGVKVVIQASRDFNNLRQLRLNAGTAVAYGLPRDEALRTVTANAAEAWGVGAETGSLTVGRAADVVVWDGDPLETSSYPVAVFVNGRQQTLNVRGQALRDRYLKTDSPMPPAYR